MAAPHLSFLVLTEDSGKHAAVVIRALAEKMLRLIEPGHDAKRLRFEPANDQARHVMRGNGWESKKAHHRRVDLIRAIATKLCEHGGFVLFHFDGDRPWSGRVPTPRRTNFEKWIVAHVKILLTDPVFGRRDAAPRAPMPPDEVEKRLTRLLPLVPYYSIEAWLYQNIGVAIKLCHDHHGGKDADKFTAWRDQPGALDEVDKPKDTICLADKHNRELATNDYPAPRAHDHSPSFQAAVESLRCCDDLCAALAAISFHVAGQADLVHP